MNFLTRFFRSAIGADDDASASDYTPPDYTNQVKEPGPDKWTAAEVAKAAQRHAEGTQIQFLGGPTSSPVARGPEFAQMNYWPGLDSLSPFLMPAVEVKETAEVIRGHELEPLSTIGGLYESGVKTVCACRRK